MKNHSVNYFGESELHHSIRRALKRHQHLFKDKDSKKGRTAEQVNADMISFIREFPRKAQQHKLSQLFLSKTDFDTFKKSFYNNKYLTEENAKNTYAKRTAVEYNKLQSVEADENLSNRIRVVENKLTSEIDNFKSMFVEKSVLEQNIANAAEVEKQIRTDIGTLKGELENQMNDVNAKLTPLSNVNKVITTNRSEVNHTMNTLRNDLTDLGKRVCSWKTFDSYRKNHETDFNNKVQEKEESLKKDFVNLLGEKLGSHEKDFQETVNKEKVNIRKELTELVVVKVTDFLKEESNKVKFLHNLRNVLLLRITDTKIVLTFQKFWTRSDEITEDMIDNVIDELCNELIDKYMELEIQTIKSTIPLSDDSIQIFVKPNIIEELKQGIDFKIKNLVLEPLLGEKLKPLMKQKLSGVLEETASITSIN